MRFEDLITLVCLLLVSAAAGPATNSWFAHAWRTDDGLPDNAISGLAQTPDGFLWVGTPGGLMRFDGARFQEFSPVNIPGVPNRVVRAMTLDHQGRLWLGMDRGVVVCVSRDGRACSASQDGLPDLVQKKMVVDGEGAVWISYVGDASWRLADQRRPGDQLWHAQRVAAGWPVLAGRRRQRPIMVCQRRTTLAFSRTAIFKPC